MEHHDGASASAHPDHIADGADGCHLVFTAVARERLKKREEMRKSENQKITYGQEIFIYISIVLWESLVSIKLGKLTLSRYW